MTLSPSIQPILARCRSFVRNTSGASAIEFAFILPLLLVMYVGTLELSLGIETNKKVARSAAIIGDLVAQESSFDKNTLDDILTIGSQVLLPYHTTQPKITITGVSIDGEKDATVAWQRTIDAGKMSGSGKSDTKVDVPTQMLIPNTFLVKVESKLDYRPVLNWDDDNKNFGHGGTSYTSAFTSIPMGEHYFFTPRQATLITCSNC